MHNVTQAYMAVGLHTAGGANSLVGEVNTEQAGMRTGGNSPGGQSGMSGEMGGSDPAHTAYGMMSVVAKATGLGSGKGKGAETTIGFPGGNRSFQMMGNVFDRRHAWKGGKEGEVGMHGLKEWGQQFLNSADGMFMTGNTEKKMRFALVANKNGQQQQGGGGGGAARGIDAVASFGLGVEAMAADSGGGSGGGGQGGQEGQQEKLGQEDLSGEKSECFIEQTKDKTEHVNKQHIIKRTSDVAFEVNPDDKCYVAGLKDKHKFSKILTEDGPMPKGMGRID